MSSKGEDNLGAESQNQSPSTDPKLGLYQTEPTMPPAERSYDEPGDILKGKSAFEEAFEKMRKSGKPFDTTSKEYLFSVLLGLPTEETESQGAAASDIAHEEQTYDAYVEKATSLRALATVLRSQAKLEEAIDYLRKALSVCPPGHPAHDNALSNLGGAFFESYLLTNEIKALDEACACYRGSLELRPPGHQYRGAMLNNLGVTYLNRYHHLRESQDLENAIEYHRNGLLIRPVGHPERGSSLINLAACLLQEFERSEDLAALENAVKYYHEGLLSFDAGHPILAASHLGYANALFYRFQRHSELGDLNKTIDQHRKALILHPIRSPAKLESLNNLANALASRFEVEMDIGDLDEAIQLHRERVSLVPEGNYGQSVALRNLSGVLWWRYMHTGDGDSLDEAIRCIQQGLKEVGTDSTERVILLTSYAGALGSRFSQRGNILDVDHAMQLQKEAIELMPHHPQRAASDENYARLLMISYQQRGTCDDLEEARMLNHKLLDLRPPGHKERPTSLMDLGNCLIAHFRRDGDKKSLDNAIGYYQEAVRLLKEAHIYPSGALNNLGGALQYRFQLTGDSNDLNGALDSLQEAIKHETLHSQRSTRISNLSIISVNKYLHTGDFGHIEAAILGSRGAREYIFSDHPHRFTTLCNLAVILLFRYQRLWDYTDLEEAIQHLHEALGLVPKDHAARLDALSILAPSLLDRFKNAQSSDSQDLNNSIKYNREVLDLRSPRDIYRLHTLHNLAVCLVTQYELYGDQKSLREAIQHHQSALELQPPGHPHRYRSHSHLASSLLLLQNLEKTSLNPTLSNAIDHYNSALELLPENHPERAEVMAGLAAAYINHEDSTIPHQIRLDKVVELFEAAVEHPTADVATRLRIAHQWANTAGLDEASVLRALQKCIELFDRFTLIRPSVGARLKMHGFLRQPTNFASDAASYALQLEQVETAVECLEQGRSLLWSQLGRYRVSLSMLKRADSRLAEEFTRLSTLLERASLTALPDNLPWLSKEEMAIHYRKTSEEWDSVVEQIRMHPGFEHFLEIAPFTALQQASAGGPVVMINIGTLRSDAIIIRKEGEPIVVRLRNSSPKDIDILAFQFSGALSPLATERSRNRTIQGILQVLWEDIVDPVVSELQKIGLPHGARIWWCPTHKLSYLPLHAAGPYIRAKRNLPDLYISSYTPTLSSLIRSLGLGSDLQRDKNIPELLLIAQPKGSDQMLPEKDLTKVLEEVHTINRLLPSVNMLRNEEATYEAVVNGLKGHQWVHFACHGTQRLTDPFQSYFHLHQSSLRLLDIIQQQIPIAEFAYTAACHSAAVNKKTPDEIIHLAAGLQFSGFKSVIGTLYPMADDDGPAVAEAVYKHVFYDGENLKSKVDYRDAATALNLAATKLRDRGTPLFRWINFVHIGA